MSNLTFDNTHPVEESQKSSVNINYEVNNQNDNELNPINNYVDNIMDYIVNPNDNGVISKNVVENHNHSISNTVEKVIINPDTLSTTKKDNNLLGNIVLPEDLVTQINNELNQSLMMDHLENSILNNIEESPNRNVHSLDSLYLKRNVYSFNDVEELMAIQNQNDEVQTTFRKTNNSNSNSLFKKVMNGLFLDRDEKTKSTSVPDLSSIDTKEENSRVNGLSSLFSLSNPNLNPNTSNTLNGLKSISHPSISSPKIDNAVIISSFTNKPSHQAVSSKSSTSFPFLFKSKSSVHDINNVETDSVNSVSSIQNLKELKFMMDQQQRSSSKNEEKGKFVSSTPSNDKPTSKPLKGKRTSNNAKIDFNSFLNVFNNLSDAYAQSNESQNSLDEILSNSNDELPQLSTSAMSSHPPSISSLNRHSSISSQKSGPSYMASLPLLSNGNSYVVLPPLHNFTPLHHEHDTDTKAKNNDHFSTIPQIKVESNENDTTMELESELPPMSLKQSISYSKNSSYLNQTPPQKNVLFNPRHSIY